MGTLSALMDLSNSALRSGQAALNIVSTNVANQNTVGYTREVATYSSDVVSIGGAGSSSAAGNSLVNVSAVSQRDRVLEQRVQQQTQVSSDAAARQGALTQLEGVFGLSSTTASAISTTLGSAIDSFYNSFSLLANAPANTSARQAVLSDASALVSAFQSAATQVGSIGSGLAQTAVSVVGEVNGLTKTIAGLNKEIGALSPNADAGQLEDQRQSAVAQLSKYIGLDQVTTESNGLTLSTSSGAVLVSGDQSFALTAAIVGTGVQITAQGSATDISAQITGGQLGGLIAVQQGSVAALSSQLDALAYGVATAVNQQNKAGLDLNGAAGQALFVVGATATGAAATISLATTDPALVAAAGPGEGSAGNTNANALAALSNSAVVSGQSATVYFAGVLSGLGNDAANAGAESTAQTAALTQLTTQRNSLSGVSLDEEASSLTQFERSYQAAAKVFSIVNTLLEAAINLGTVTTV